MARHPKRGKSQASKPSLVKKPKSPLSFKKRASLEHQPNQGAGGPGKDKSLTASARKMGISRGRTRPGKIRRKTLTVVDPSDPRERALDLVKAGKTRKAAAKAEGVSLKKLRRYMKENTTVKRKGGKLIIIDRRPVMMLILSIDKPNPYWMPARKRTASKIGHYWNAINKFIETNKISHLEPFNNRGVYDANRKYHPWETRPNILRRLERTGELSFVTIYRDKAD